MTESDERRAAKQRRFYMNLFPAGGHVLAKNLSGYLDPGLEVKEMEVKDAMILWMTTQHSGAINSIHDTAWWMTRFLDPHSRMSKMETDIKHSELMSFIIAAVGDLVEEGYLDWKNRPELPVIFRTSDQDLVDDSDRAVLKRMEKNLKEMEDGE